MRFFFLCILLFLCIPLQARADYSRLTASDIQRVKAVKEMLSGVDTKSLQQTIDELSRSPYPRLNLAIKEAIAQAYTDIVRDYDVQGRQKKQWLYSMVCLNMAYLQFNAGQASGGGSDLNRLIRQELKKYLSASVLKRAGSLSSLQQT